jgi:hypothetical protein
LALGLPAVSALQILFGAVAGSSVVEGFVSVCFYEKEIHNG